VVAGEWLSRATHQPWVVFKAFWKVRSRARVLHAFRRRPFGFVDPQTLGHAAHFRAASICVWSSGKKKNSQQSKQSGGAAKQAQPCWFG
jgi:hypothetical protein